MMHFEQPGALWFLGLIIIPIFIHLYQFHKTRILYFPGVFRLKQQLQTARKQKQIQHWLVLLFRVLAIVFLVFAFSMPSCNPKQNQASGRWIFVLDNSLSMKRKNADGELFEQAKSQLRKVLKQIGNDGEAMLVIQSDVYQQSWKKPAEIIQMLDTLECYDQYSGAKEWKIQVEHIQETEGLGKAIKVIAFTDAETSAFKDINGLLDSNSTEYGIQQWQWVHFKGGENTNVGIDSAWADLTNVQSDGSTAVMVRLVNYGNEAVKTILKAQKYAGEIVSGEGVKAPFGNSSPKNKIRVKGDETNANSSGQIPENPKWKTEQKQLLIAQEVELKGGERKEILVKWPVGSMGSNANAMEAVRLEIGQDNYIYDNFMWLHPQRSWKWKIGIIGNHPQVERMFSVQDKVELVRLALPLNKADLENLTAICVVGNIAVGGNTREVLLSYLADGGNLLQLPLQQGDVVSVMGKLSGKWEAKPFEIDIEGFKHPILQGVFEQLPVDKTEVPSLGSRFQFLDENATPILKTMDGWPLLIEKDIDQGRYFLWLSDLNKGSANWLNSSWSLPVFTQVLAGNSLAYSPLFGSLMGKQILPLPTNLTFQEAGLPLFPMNVEPFGVQASNQQLIAMMEFQKMAGGHSGIFIGDHPKTAGMYAAFVEGNWLLLALNHNRQESSLSELEIDKQLKVTDSARGETVLSATEQSQLWRWLLGLSLLCLLMEMLLLRVGAAGQSPKMDAGV